MNVLQTERAGAVDLLFGRAEHRRDTVFHWTRERIARLHTKVENPAEPEFVRACAQSQLASAAGNSRDATRLLRYTLEKFWQLYPHSGHFCEHIIQAAICLQNFKLAATIIEDHCGTGEFLRIVPLQSTLSQTANLARFNPSRQCEYWLDPRIPGAADADYFISHWRSPVILLANYCKSINYEPGGAVFNVGEHGHVPGVAYCANTSDFLLVPDNYFITSQGYSELKALFDKKRPSWETRSPLAFWRGGTTGIRQASSSWKSLPRVQLAEISREHAGLIDAKLSTVVQTLSPAETEEIRLSGLVAGPAAQEEFLKYKYQIDIDGNSNSWPGLIQKLLTGSPVLKVESPLGFRQWYYDKLEPGRNFIPVKADLSDLIEKIEWLNEHDREAEEIGSAGLMLAQSLSYEGEIDASSDTIRTAVERLKLSTSPKGSAAR
jgi:hypothetical protein